MKKIYIAGPMTGKKDLNKAAFIQAEAKLIRNGWETINPVSYTPLTLPTTPYV